MSGPTRGLGRILEEWLRVSGLDRAVRAGKLQQDWESIVGPRVSAVSRPIDVRGETLVIEVKNPVWRNELSLLQDTILAQVRDHQGAPAVTKIRFVGGRGQGART
jgi:predicted nucleic acid-binding Zn ribbon protein